MAPKYAPREILGVRLIKHPIHGDAVIARQSAYVVGFVSIISTLMLRKMCLFYDCYVNDKVSVLQL